MYGYVGSNPAKWLDPFGLVPTGNKHDWGSGGGSMGNCWRYACNDPGKPGEEHGPFPGGPDLGGTITCAQVMRNARYLPGVSPPSRNGECVGCQYKILLVLTLPNKKGWNDYHWYRQDDDGNWSGKPGSTPVVPVPPGTSPEDDARSHGYPTICGYLCVSGRGIDLDNPNPGPDLDEIAERPWPVRPLPTPVGNPRRRDYLSYRRSP